MKLVIAEKPSVARSIADVLGAEEHKNGYLEGNGYLVSWCVGHLVELADASAYGENYAKWRMEDLPILPGNWSYAVTPGTGKQFDILKNLMAREDTVSLICATDAGREGELIFRLVYEQAGCRKPVERLWISSMEDSAIREGFSHLRPAADYDWLYAAALCRAQADWLVGINATRFFSLLYRRTLNIGRVMTPTLALAVKREADISAFMPQPFFTVAVDLGGFTAAGERLADKAQAEAVRDACLKVGEAVVKAAGRRKRTEKPPALYDLTTLQREANRLLGFTAQQTLDYLQSLYEKKLATYPRTDSRYLTSDMEKHLPELAGAAAAVADFDPGVLACNTAQVIDDAKVGDHHAVIPTMAVQEADLSGLPAGERAVLQLLVARLLCAVGDPCISEEASIAVECAGETFKANSRTVTDPGWRGIDESYKSTLKNRTGSEKETERLPGVETGDRMDVASVSIKEGKTSAPEHYTEDTLLLAMETAGRGDMPDEAERKGLGTPATRAGILEKLIKVGFLERRKVKKTVHLVPSQTGMALITVLPEQVQSPSMTAEWEHQLKEIERGTVKPEAFLSGIAGMLTELTSHYEAVKDASVLFPGTKDSVGRCPRCGGPVMELPKSYSCEKRDCGFVIWKNAKFFMTKRKQPTRAFVTALLATGRARLSGCYSEKTGKTYDAVVMLDDTGGRYVNFKMEFEGGKRK